MKQSIDLLIQFIIGGGTIVGMSYLGTQVNPKFAALLYAIPIQFTLAAIFISKGTQKETIQHLSVYTIVSLFILIFFVGIFYILTKKFDFWMSLVIAYVIFISCSIFFINYFKIGA